MLIPSEKLGIMANIDGLIYRKRLSDDITIRFPHGGHVTVDTPGGLVSYIPVALSEIDDWMDRGFIERAPDDGEYLVYRLTDAGRERFGRAAA